MKLNFSIQNKKYKKVASHVAQEGEKTYNCQYSNNKNLYFENFNMNVDEIQMGQRLRVNYSIHR
jgi:hypothetical protein